MKWLFGVLLVGYLGVVLFTNSGLYFSRFDPAYWKDKYEHSQWKLPQSHRGIGDDGLYLYEGYRLMQSADLVLFNAEVPPLGKYAIGESIRLFGNGYVYGLVTMTLVLVVFFFVAKAVLKHAESAAALTLLLAADPLVTSQFSLTMLEGIQLLFLLLTFLCILLFLRKPRTATSMLCGVCFGVFSASKFPLFSPVIGIAALWVLWEKTRHRTAIALFVLCAFLAYVAPYARYFQLGHNLIAWLGVQKWIVNFYLHANLLPTWGSMAATMLFGKTQNIFTRAWEQANPWSAVWPLLFILGFWTCIRMRRMSAPGRIGLVTLATIVILLNVIPFWTRYLLLVLPFLYLAAAVFLKPIPKKLGLLLFAVVFMANGWASTMVLFPTPQASVNQFLYDWQEGLFQDMYEQVTPDVKNRTNRDQFYRFGQKAFSDAQIEAATITTAPVSWSRFQSKQTVALRITYFTRNLGSFTQETLLPVLRINGRWRIPWEWKFLMDSLSESSLIQTSVIPAKRGSLIARNGTVLAQDSPSILVSVIPQDVDTAKEEEMLKFLESLFDQRVAAVALHSRYVENSQPDLPVALGVIMRLLDRSAYQKLISYPGIRLTPALGRFIGANPTGAIIGSVANTQFFECCSLLYTTTTYDGISGLEQQYNEVLKGQNGGSLVLKDSQGVIIRTLIQKEKHEGGNVQL